MKYKIKIIDECPTCKSKDLKQVDEPNGGGKICNNCNAFIRWDNVILTPEPKIKKAFGGVKLG